MAPSCHMFSLTHSSINAASAVFASTESQHISLGRNNSSPSVPSNRDRKIATFLVRDQEQRGVGLSCVSGQVARRLVFTRFALSRHLYRLPLRSTRG